MTDRDAPIDADARARRLFVTGGSGLLGRRVVAAARAAGWRVDAPSSADVDLRDRRRVALAIGAARPDAVVHTAYRRDEEAAIVDATRHVAEAATAVGARLVHVSTDALFAGRPEPYREDDPPDPVHDYGRWKAVAEHDVDELCPDRVIVRTSLLFSPHEPTAHEHAVHEVAAGRSPMAFFTDEVRSPVFADDLAVALVELAAMPTPPPLLHLGGPEALSRAELAVLVARRRGWPDSGLRFSSIAEAGLARPGNVVLDSSRAAALGFRLGGPGDWGVDGA